MSFPEPLLIKLAEEKQLSERETQVFLALFCEGKTRLEIAERLHVQDSAVSTCLSGVYKKFRISESGPVKESRLKDELRRREEIWRRQQSVNQSDRLSTQVQSQDALFQQVKERCRQKILNLHSRMRLLSGKEIGVDQLYVDMWLQDRPSRNYQAVQSEIEQNPGFKIASDNPKLLILGRPGSGKTTFLSHLAVGWCRNEFQSDLIAVFIELGLVQDKTWQLLAVISKELGLQDSQTEAEAFLKQGKLLVLMDGLDEVPTTELRDEVQKQLREITREYYENRFILTCRTQIIEAIPDRFTVGEIADFSEERARQFVQKWFESNGKGNVEAAQNAFEQAVSNNSALRELTITPVLLSLICLILQDKGEIPSKIDELYQKGIVLMLSGWNAQKGIKKWELGSREYAEFDIERREALLIEIAGRKFENPANFALFNQNEITAYITNFLQLPNYSQGLEVLKAVEAQNGLLIERADKMWSFSHLTFQEYFTICWLTQLPVEQIAEKIANQQWRERVEQLVKSHQPADRLVRLIKQAIDQSIAKESTLQSILVWVLEKSKAIQAKYRPAAIRAFYFTLDLDLDLDRDLVLTLDHNLDRTLDFDRAYARDRDLAYAIDLVHAIDLARTRDGDLARDPDLAHARTLAFLFVLARARELDLAHAFDLDCGSELANSLEQLRVALPIFSITDREFLEWWQANRTQWVTQFHQVVIQYRNIGHDLQLADQQKEQLQRHYAVNHFLVKLINIEGAVTDRARTEIEDSLLLPWEELQRRYPKTYGQSQSP